MNLLLFYDTTIVHEVCKSAKTSFNENKENNIKLQPSYTFKAYVISLWLSSDSDNFLTSLLLLLYMSPSQNKHILTGSFTGQRHTFVDKVSCNFFFLHSSNPILYGIFSYHLLQRSITELPWTNKRLSRKDSALSNWYCYSDVIPRCSKTILCKINKNACNRIKTCLFTLKVCQ